MIIVCEERNAVVTDQAVYYGRPTVVNCEPKTDTET